jgi:flagellin
MNGDLLMMALELSMSDARSGARFTDFLMNGIWADIVGARLDRLAPGSGRTRGDLLGTALGGALRGDAAMLRQASSNVLEAKSIMDTASSAVGEIARQVGEARGLVEDFQAAAAGIPPYDPAYADLLAVYGPQYEAIGKNINNIIRNTRYNGIALLDGDAWAGDERLSLAPGTGVPETASVYIAAGTDGFPLTFSNMRPRFFDIAGSHDIANVTTPDELDILRNTAETLAELYAGRSGGLAGQGLSLRSQAKILEEAAARRAGGGDARSLLLDLILRDTGILFDGKG